jgi:endonuclease G
MKKNKTLLLVGTILTLLAIYQYNKDESNKKVIEAIETNQKESSMQLDFLLPKSIGNQVIQHTIYTLSYNENHEQADWVAYKLYKNSINDSVKRKDDFRIDPKVTTSSATLSDYKRSGYDRGHLAPAKVMSFSNKTMSESFYMSNMSPQKPSFNRGIWKKLEEQVRSWIHVSDTLYVVTGPVLDKKLGSIGANNVSIPRAYYKVILRFKNSQITGIGFLLNNEKSSLSLNSFTTPIDSIETVTGLDFFYQLNDSIENSVEENNTLEDFIK